MSPEDFAEKAMDDILNLEKMAGEQIAKGDMSAHYGKSCAEAHPKVSHDEWAKSEKSESSKKSVSDDGEQAQFEKGFEMDVIENLERMAGIERDDEVKKSLSVVTDDDIAALEALASTLSLSKAEEDEDEKKEAKKEAEEEAAIENPEGEEEGDEDEAEKSLTNVEYNALIAKRSNDPLADVLAWATTQETSLHDKAFLVRKK